MKLAKLLPAVAVLILAQPAFGFTCAGVISYIALANNGAVAINNGYGTLLICSTTGTVESTSSDTCKMFYSQILTASTTRKSVRLYFDPSSPSVAGATDCSNFGNWTWKVPYYIDQDF